MQLSAMDWISPSSFPRLGENEAHIWRIDFSDWQGREDAFVSILTSDESERASRFRLLHDRQRFILRHGLLRTILSGYLGMPSASLRFDYSSYGKPDLHTDYHKNALHFNMSHSHQMALIAVASHEHIGVDIEYVRSDFDHQRIATQFFSIDEQEQLRRVAAAERARAFFMCWTRKEAYIKALGMGLSLPLDQFDVSLHPAQPAKLLAARNDLPGPEHWSLYHLEPARDYAAALCLPRGDWRLRGWKAEPHWLYPGISIG
jgi:4'-phosphopantetheinyl transferase